MAPISLVMVVWQTNPFWVSIMAYFMLKEAMYVSEIVAMFICFAGVAVIASQSEQASTTDHVQLIGLICGFGAAVCQAMVIVLNRALKGTPAPVVVFFHTINGLLLALSFIGIEALLTGNETRLTQYSVRQYLICLAASIFDSGELLFITVAC